jgi:hypothetical protein
MKPFRCIFALTVCVAFAIFLPSRSLAWGCKGHYVTALIAARHLNPQVRDMVAQILDAGPIDPQLSRYCKGAWADPFTDSSTWADDERSIDSSTAGWHFIDIPRGVFARDISQYCPASAGCVTKAIADQLALLRDPHTPGRAKADALRYVIHFIGDIHQPLHTTSNNDRGGNCVPIDFFGHAPTETNAQKESFQPNLHSIWDTDLIDRFSGDRTPQQLANDLDSQFRQQIPAWQSASLDPDSWAWEGHEVAERSVYGFLPNKIVIEKPRQISSCADDDHIAMRMLNLNEKLADDYQKAVTPVVQEQLVKAGVRLAAVLNSLWP